MRSGLVKTCPDDPAAAITTIDASVVFVLMTWPRQTNCNMVLTSGDMTMEKGPSQYAPFERSKGNPCRTAQLAFTAMHAATSHGVHHAVDTLPAHDTTVEAANPRTEFLVPPKNLGGKLSDHFNPIAAAIPVRKRDNFSVVFCVGAAALASYVSQLAGTGGNSFPPPMSSIRAASGTRGTFRIQAPKTNFSGSWLRAPHATSSISWLRPGTSFNQPLASYLS